MAHVFADRVADTSSTTGLSSFALDNQEPTGYRNFDAVCANADTIYYVASHAILDEWEVGLGTYGAGTNVLARTTVLASSNSGSKVTFSGGTKHVFGGLPASAISGAVEIGSLTRTRGDLIVGGASSWTDLAIGTSGYHLQSDGTDAAWAGFVQAGSGVSTRTWQAKLRDHVSVKDFGALGDASNDDTAEIQAAIDSGATHVYFPAGTYKVTATITVSQKVGLHIYGDSGGSNGTGASKIYWAGSANGIVFKVFSSNNCTIERLAIQGILGGTPTNPGIGFWLTALNASGASHWNVIRDCTVSAIGGTPGYGVYVGSSTDDDIATNYFDNVLIVGGTVSLVQDGTQTVHNVYRNVECLDFTSLGMQFIEGDVRVENGSFFGTTAATADVEIGTATLWASIRGSYHEIESGRPAGAVAYSFPSGTRAYGTELDTCRVLWDRASGNIINYLQRGALSVHDCTVDGSGTGVVTVTVGGATARAVVIYGNYYLATVTYAVTGAVNLVRIEDGTYALDARNTTGAGAVHISGTGLDDGGYIAAPNASLIDLSGGANFNGANWVAKATGAGILVFGNGVASFFSDTGLTPGNTFTPTLRWQTDATGFASGTATPDRRLHSEVDDATNNAVTQLLRLTHTTSGSPSAGIGAGLEFEVETGASNNEIGATIEAITTDVTGASEDFDLSFKVMAGGATAAEKLRVASTGVVSPGVSDQSALGSTSLMWSDLFLASGAVVNFNNGNVTITHAAGLLTLAGGGLVLAAGTTSLAPLKLQSGTSLTTAAAGAIEYDGTAIYGTAVASARQVIKAAQISVLSANAAGTNVNTAQPWFGDATGQDVLTVAASTTYRFRGMLIITRAAGNTSHQTANLFGGTATFTSIHYTLQATSTSGAPVGTTPANQLYAAAATATFFTNAVTFTDEHITLVIEGVMRINGAGTVIPQFQYSAAPGGAPTILLDTFFELWPIGSNTVQTVGNWA